MIVISLSEIIALCLGGVALLFLLGVLLYAKISNWFYNKFHKEKDGVE